MKRFCSQFLKNEDGATAIEYGLIASGITLAILGSVQALSNTVRTVLWEIVAASMAS